MYLVKRKLQQNGWLVLVAAVIIAINLWALGDYPPPHCDEAVLTDISYHLIQSGTPHVTILGKLAGYDQISVRPSLIYQLGLGAVLHVFGNSLKVARLFSSIGWLAATIVTYLVGRQLYQKEVGLLSALVFATSLNVFQASHTAREETWVIASGMGIVCFYLYLRCKPSVPGYILLGILAALALEVHPNTIWYSFPVALLVVSERSRTGQGRLQIVSAALATLLMIGVLVLVHVLPEPHQALDRFSLFAAQNHFDERNTLAGILVKQLRFFRGGYVQAYNGVVLAYTILSAAGIGYAIYKRDQSDKTLLGMWAISVAAFSVLMPHKSGLYHSLWDSFLALFIGAGAYRAGARLAQHLSTQRAWLIGALLCALLIGGNLLGQAWLSHKFSPRNYESYAAAILQLIPPGEAVIGPGTLWQSFEGRNPYTGTGYFRYLATIDPGFSYSASDFGRELEILTIDFVIYDGTIDCLYETTPESRAYEEHLSAACTAVGEVDDPWFGAGANEINGQATVIYQCIH